MGWQPTGEPGSFTRRLDDAPGVEAIFERFTRHIETMVRQSARLEQYGAPASNRDLDVHVSDAALAGHLMADSWAPLP